MVIWIVIGVKKLNNKGFTLVEVIAVVVIMAILAIILIPSVTKYINEGREEALDGLKKSIVIAAKEYINDNRYNINLTGSNGNYVILLEGINGNKISVRTLLDRGYLSASGTDSDGVYISSPNNQNSHLDLDNSYVEVSFDDTINDFKFGDAMLVWPE